MPIFLRARTPYISHHEDEIDVESLESTCSHQQRWKCWHYLRYFCFVSICCSQSSVVESHGDHPTFSGSFPAVPVLVENVNQQPSAHYQY